MRYTTYKQAYAPGKFDWGVKDDLNGFVTFYGRDADGQRKATAVARALNACESDSLDLPELPRGEHFDRQMRQETYSAAQMKDYARAARACAPLPEGLLIVGDVMNGFAFIGPFACESDAASYAATHYVPCSWDTCTMQAPETDA